MSVDLLLMSVDLQLMSIETQLTVDLLTNYLPMSVEGSTGVSRNSTDGTPTDPPTYRRHMKDQLVSIKILKLSSVNLTICKLSLQDIGAHGKHSRGAAYRRSSNERRSVGQGPPPPSPRQEGMWRKHDSGRLGRGELRSFRDSVAQNHED